MSSDSISSTLAACEERIKHIADSTKPGQDRDGFLSEMDDFKKLFGRFLATKNKSFVDWAKISPPPEGMVIPEADLTQCPPNKRAQLANKLCVLKLNGGLGTTMGCVGPKSVIEVRGDITFLDLTVHQIQHLNTELNVTVPFILMNSFNTHKETQKVIRKYEHCNVRVLTFNQSRFPRIVKDNMMPFPETYDKNQEEWYPPGHGDVFKSFFKSGLLQQMIAEGREYVFLSNVDNLGATVDFNILNHLVENNVEFAMEVTDKTRADVKGGTLIEYEGKAKLLEIAQVHPSKVEEFKSIKKFKIFNTNNLWINLKAIDRLVRQSAFDNMDIIYNPKAAEGVQVIQLETAAGAGIEYFNNAKGINVSRSRFLPVKSCSDLFVVQSNIYNLDNGLLLMNPKRAFSSVPLVKLGENFKKVSDYLKRFQGIPDILELDQLTVSGDVTFGGGVVLKGTVIIVANYGSRIDIPSGSVLENKVVSGNLRILDH